MDLQHLIVKIPVEGPLGVDPAKVVDFFHPWVATQAVPGVVLVDVAELLHVPDGPGVVLVGYEADYAFDHTGGIWGALYRRKDIRPGGNVDRLRQAYEAARSLASQLEAAFPGQIAFSRRQLEIVINDRGIAPNTPETYAAAVPEIEASLRALFPGNSAELARHDQDRRQRFGVTATFEKAL